MFWSEWARIKVKKDWIILRCLVNIFQTETSYGFAKKKNEWGVNWVTLGSKVHFMYGWILI